MRLIGLPLILAVGLVLAPLAEAQPAGRVYRIGFLGTAAASGQANRVEALRAGLRDLGDVEGKNIVIEYRWAEGKYDRLPDLVAELVALKVDVIVTSGGTPPALAAKQATTTIPIVMAGTGDAVAAGLVSSLARPGGNITGLTDFVPELMAKRLELLKGGHPARQARRRPQQSGQSRARGDVKGDGSYSQIIESRASRIRGTGADRVRERFFNDD
jgi:putative ABC transport system substrate-binding protein